jgi:hypothetical protein
MYQYMISGTVFQRNEFMHGHPKEYERSWELSDEIYVADTEEECIEKVKRDVGVREDEFGLVELRDFQIVDKWEIKPDGYISLQTGRMYDNTTIISVEARNIRSAESEGFISMRGAMRAEITYNEEEWHVSKHNKDAEWRLDCIVGEEREVRRGRIVLEADQPTYEGYS